MSCRTNDCRTNDIAPVRTELVVLEGVGTELVELEGEGAALVEQEGVGTDLVELVGVGTELVEMAGEVKDNWMMYLIILSLTIGNAATTEKISFFTSRYDD